MSHSLRHLLWSGIAIYLLLFLGGLFWFVERAGSAESLSRVEGAMIDFDRGVLDLALLAADLGATGSPRASSQWDRRMEQLRGLLDSIDQDPRLDDPVARLREQLELTHRALLRAGRQKSQETNMLLNLLAHTQRLGALAQAVSVQVRDLGEAVRWQAIAELGLLLGLFILVALAKFAMLGRWIRQPVTVLSKAAERMGRGELSQSVEPVAIREFQALATAMDRMRERLANLTVSRDRLSVEVERRRAAQAEAQSVFGRLQEAQLQMVQMEKLTALGTLVGGVAHEINNPLMGIMNYVEYARDRAQEGRARLVLGRAMDELLRIARIVRNMLVFARSAPSEPQSLPVAEVVHVVLDLLQTELRKQAIEVNVNIDPHLPPALCDADTLQQVVINLLMNARDAMEKSECRCIDIAAYPRQDRQTVVLEVSDSGSGIEQDVQTRIFDPFFTTKPAGKGTGLGLSVSKQMIEASGGKLSLVTRPEGGARATVELKAALAEPVLLRSNQ